MGEEKGKRMEGRERGRKQLRHVKSWFSRLRGKHNPLLLSVSTIIISLLLHLQQKGMLTVPFRSHPQSRMSTRHYPGTSLSCMCLSNDHYLDFLVLLLHKQSKQIPDRSAGNHCCHCLWQESRHWIHLIGHQMDCGR